MPEITRAIPVLVYDDIPAAHEFLVSALGFEPGGVAFDDDGRAVHGEVRAGGTAIWLHQVTEEHQLESPRAGVAGSGIVVHVDDADAHCERARAAGAVIEYGPTDMPYGAREYGVRDPEGHRWWFASPLHVASTAI